MVKRMASGGFWCQSIIPNRNRKDHASDAIAVGDRIIELGGEQLTGAQVLRLVDFRKTWQLRKSPQFYWCHNMSQPTVCICLFNFGVSKGYHVYQFVCLDQFAFNCYPDGSPKLNSIRVEKSIFILG